MKYTPEVSHKSDFSIIMWSSKIAGQKFEGRGNILSPEFMEYMKSINSGELISIEVMVKSSFGTTRKIVRSWTKA